ncbi:MAG: DUF418 domain-containing protein [Gammaproteobacteria bacterium]|nr:DUF418 domain-containing protein [Gammaproteobacteria bacterium]
MTARSAAAPLERAERIPALDVARGIAVLGVLVMNIWSFAGPQAFFDYPRAIAGHAGEPVATWAVVHTLFEGTQRTLLSLLFGAGAFLILQRLVARAGPAAARRIYLRRTALLAGLGLVNAYLFLWPADILFVYGLAGLCLYPLQRLRTPVLVAVVLATLAVPVGLRLHDLSGLRALEAGATAAAARLEAGQAVGEADSRAIAAWQAKLAKARPDAGDPELAGSMHVMQTGTLAEIAARQARVSLILQTIVAAKWWFLDALALMLIGLLGARHGLLVRPEPRAVRLALIAGGFGIGLPLATWQTATLLATDFHPVASVVTMLGYDLRRLAMTAGYLGLILAFCHTAAGGAVKRALAATGRMALTNYLGQSIVCGLLFYGFGLGLYGRVAGYQLYGIVALVWALEIAWSVAWLARFRIGPFEWLWRSLTYGQRQPWHDPQPAPAAAIPHGEATHEHPS